MLSLRATGSGARGRIDDAGVYGLGGLHDSDADVRGAPQRVNLNLNVNVTTPEYDCECKCKRECECDCHERAGRASVVIHQRGEERGRGWREQEVGTFIGVGEANKNLGGWERNTMASDFVGIMTTV